MKIKGMVLPGEDTKELTANLGEGKGTVLPFCDWFYIPDKDQVIVEDTKELTVNLSQRRI